MILDIPGITIKPYVRMTQRGKYVSEQAQEYLASKAGLQEAIQAAMLEQGYAMLPAQTPLWVCIEVTVPSSQGHRADLDNILKAVLDACNGVAFPDDRWVDDISIVRKIGPPYLGIDIQEVEG